MKEINSNFSIYQYVRELGILVKSNLSLIRINNGGR